MVIRPITKAISIHAPYGEVFDFLVEPYNLPYWSIVDIESIASNGGRWWNIQTPAGKASLRVRSGPAVGVLDYDFKFADAIWTIPSRLLPNGKRCEYIVTIFAQPVFGAELFKLQAVLLDQKLAELKALIEGIT